MAQAQLFPPAANTIARLSIVGGGLLAAVAVTVLSLLYRSSYVTEVTVPKDQPVQFSHERHVAGNGIDCRYCHISVETGAFAGIPPTETCMTCHSQIFNDAPYFEPVHESWKENKPLEWVRVNDLPDFVYFDHSIHINQGIGCSTCHGEVDKMPQTWKAETLRMGWCLQCHKAPEKFVRDIREDDSAIFQMDWEPAEDQHELGKQLVKEYGIEVEQLTNCSICHR